MLQSSSIAVDYYVVTSSTRELKKRRDLRSFSNRRNMCAMVFCRTIIIKCDFTIKLNKYFNIILKSLCLHLITVYSSYKHIPGILCHGATLLGTFTDSHSAERDWNGDCDWDWRNCELNLRNNSICLLHCYPHGLMGYKEFLSLYTTCGTPSPPLSLRCFYQRTCMGTCCGTTTTTSATE